MKYLGSKNRLAKEIVPIIQSFIKEDTQYYVEPFVGGANIIDKIKHSKKIGVDVHPYLIELLKYVQSPKNELPFEITEEEYNDVKNNKESYPKWFVGLVGFGATFGAKWFGGYARSFKADGVTPRNQSNESIRNIEKQRSNLDGIQFVCSSYENMTNITNSVVYCDIPYRDTTGYGISEFDYEKFYQWCVDLSRNGNTVLVSEYSIPDSRFEVIWEKEHKTLVSKQTEARGLRIEKIYKVL